MAYVAKRLFGVTDFHYYALADGIATVFSRLGPWARAPRPNPTPPATLLLPGLSENWE
jgi:hypothetical protein